MKTYTFGYKHHINTSYTMIPALRNKDFENCCRTCLNDISSKFYELFAKYQNSTTLAEILLICTSIMVDGDDKLPKKMCGSCYNCLVSFYDFRLQAEKVEDALKKSQAENMKLEPMIPPEQSFQIQVKIENINNTEDSNINDNSENDFNDSDFILEEKQKQISLDSDDLNCYNVLQMKIENCDKEQGLGNNTVYKCNICDRKFRTLLKLQAHERKHKHKVYSCSYCSDTFGHKYKLVKHLLQHSQKKEDPMFLEVNQNDVSQSVYCDICSANFKSVQSLSAHMRVHVEKGRVLSCSLCEKVFKKMSHLKRHELSHEVNRPFKCATCPKSFTTESLLNEHTNRHHGIRPHGCPLCSKSFSNMTSLTAHVKVHTKRKIYLCSTCGKKFDSSTNLNQHMKRHIGLKPYACNLCPKSFVSKGELKSHCLTHTGEKAFTCDQCGASFTKRATLGKHKLRHLGVKPHQCETCARKFSSKAHLKRHYRIHTGEKPYRCDICERAFTQSNDLIKHKRMHLGDKLYRCDQCSESFRLYNELRHHLSEHFITSRLQGMNMNNPSQDISNKLENGQETVEHSQTPLVDNNGMTNIEMEEKSRSDNGNLDQEQIDKQ